MWRNLFKCLPLSKNVSWFTLFHYSTIIYLHRFMQYLSNQWSYYSLICLLQILHLFEMSMYARIPNLDDIFGTILLLIMWIDKGNLSIRVVDFLKFYVSYLKLFSIAILHVIEDGGRKLSIYVNTLTHWTHTLGDLFELYHFVEEPILHGSIISPLIPQLLQVTAKDGVSLSKERICNRLKKLMDVWASVYLYIVMRHRYPWDGGPTLTQHCINVSSLQV